MSPLWLAKAGYSGVRFAQACSLVAGFIPFGWFLVSRDFGSRWFLWASLLFLVVPSLATAWAAYRIRCLVCRLPIYALWLLGFPKGEVRLPFDQTARCPYCADDGGGQTGDARRVNAEEEGLRAIRAAVLAVSGFVALYVVILLLMVLGWFPVR